MTKSQKSGGGSQMNDKGFTKLLKVVPFATNIPHCALSDQPHKFESAGQIVKYDPANSAPAPDGEGAKGEALLVQVHICNKCLLHVYTEVLRMDTAEAKRRGMFGLCEHTNVQEGRGPVN